MFLPSGIISSEQTTAERFAAKLLKGLSATSLTAADEDYVLLNPFIFNLCLPEAPIDLVTESMRVTGMPSSHTCIRLPAEVFDYGQRGRDVQIPGNLLVAIPKEQWETVRQFILSVMFIEPGSKSCVFVRLGEILLRDPFVSTSKVITDVAADTVAVQVVVVEAGRHAWVLRASTGWPLNSRYDFAMVRTSGDARGERACELFTQGEQNPLTKAEEEHGRFDFGEDGDTR